VRLIWKTEVEPKAYPGAFPNARTGDRYTSFVPTGRTMKTQVWNETIELRPPSHIRNPLQPNTIAASSAPKPAAVHRAAGGDGAGDQRLLFALDAQHLGEQRRLARVRDPRARCRYRRPPHRWRRSCVRRSRRDATRSTFRSPCRCRDTAGGTRTGTARDRPGPLWAARPAAMSNPGAARPSPRGPRAPPQNLGGARSGNPGSTPEDAGREGRVLRGGTRPDASRLSRPPALGVTGGPRSAQGRSGAGLRLARRVNDDSPKINGVGKRRCLARPLHDRVSL
jgi:hypothetical protein